MPFITEEIWQALPARSEITVTTERGNICTAPAPSIMLAEYPRYREDRSFPEAAADMERVMGVISGIRNIRGEMEVPPSREIAAMLSCGSEESVRLMKRNEGAIVNLARLASLAIGREVEKPEDASIQVAGDVQIFVPLKGLVDVEEEEKRLLKEIGKIDRDVEFLAKKLENPSFVERAPADVVAKEREKLAEFASKKRVLEESLVRIGSLR